LNDQKLSQYIAIFFIGLILVFMTGIYTLQRIDDWNNKMSSDIAENVIDTKKIIIKGHIDRTIHQLEIEKDDITVDLHTQAELFNIKLANMLAQNSTFTSECIDKMDVIADAYKPIHYIVFNTDDNSILYASEENIPDPSLHVENTTISVRTPINGITVVTYATNQIIDAIVKERMAHHIRNIRLEDDGYIWVNEVINYDGGQDYAIRRVHPNLPETEGILLSTETQDIKGGKPYLIELEGIKENGDVFFTYYFKEPNSNDVSQKITYAKLYEPYNWIIATGVYLNDVNVMIDERQQQLQYFKTIKFILFTLSAIVIGLLIFGWRFLLLFNKTKIEEQALLENDMTLIEGQLKAISEIAYQDPLTSLYNRRAMLLRLTEELSSGERHHYSSSVILCDIDYFKNINDTHGHDVGDEVLRKVALFLQAHVRKEDTIARWGGDEFLILLTHTAIDSAELVADNLRLLFQAHDYSRLVDGESFTLSFGLTTSTESDSCESLVKRADLALYESKRSGRDRVSVYHND